MAIARELFEIFLKKDKNNDYVYHLHNVEELITERDELKEIVARAAQELSAMPVPADMDKVVDLNRNLVYFKHKLARMDNVLTFLGNATKGYLLSKVITTVEWECQEPVYFTDDADKANKAFDFFNAHAVITKNN
jgi:hypothetical protein